MKPMLKYPGGKLKEIACFKDFIPSKFNTYIEPFLGGGALFFYLEPQKAIINDVNNKLMRFYLDVRENYPQMHAQLEELQRVYEANQGTYMRLKAQNPKGHLPNANKDLYYKMRDLFNHPDGSYLDGVTYYFINKTAYAGMIRYNNKGEFNVPFGYYPHFSTDCVTEEHSALLQNANVCCQDYSEVFEQAKSDDFMFLDPPYDCVFRNYGNDTTSHDFAETEQRELASDYKNLGCRALMVINKTPLTAELYAGNVVGTYAKNYAINIKNRISAFAQHMIVANYQIDHENFCFGYGMCQVA